MKEGREGGGGKEGGGGPENWVQVLDPAGRS